VSAGAGGRLGARRIAAQALAHGLFVALVGYLAVAPAYTYLGEGQALLRLSFNHAGQPVRECHRLTPEELAALPPNMRRPLDCPRERVPLLVELELDGKLLYRETLPPAGLAGDGNASAYARFPVPAGRHRLVARLRDSPREQGFDYQRAADIELAPGDNFVVGFDATAGGFQFLPPGGARR